MKRMEENIAKRLALSMAVLCVRNTILEDIHHGKEPDSQVGDFSDVKVVTPTREIPWNEVARIRDDEMKLLMQEIVNKLYTTILRLEDSVFLERMETYARGFHASWDKPQYLAEWFDGKWSPSEEAETTPSPTRVP